MKLLTSKCGYSYDNRFASLIVYDIYIFRFLANSLVKTDLIKLLPSTLWAGIEGALSSSTPISDSLRSVHKAVLGKNADLTNSTLIIPCCLRYNSIIILIVVKPADMDLQYESF